MSGLSTKNKLIVRKNEYLPAYHSSEPAYFYPLQRVLGDDNLLNFLHNLQQALGDNTAEKCNIIIVNVYMFSKLRENRFPVTVCVSEVKRTDMRVSENHDSKMLGQNDRDAYFLIRMCLYDVPILFGSNKITHLTSKLIDLPKPRHGFSVDESEDYKQLINGNNILIISEEGSEIVERRKFYPKMTDPLLDADVNVKIEKGDILNRMYDKVPRCF